jgi:hypothetical protein
MRVLSGNDLAGAGQEQCSAARADKPYVIKLPSSERGELESRLRRGLVLVRYSGCSLEVVEDCEAPPNLAYSYVAITPKDDEVRIRTAAELYASIPIGAADLAGKLQSSGELRVQSLIAGRYESPAMSVKLSSLDGPGCASATHAVRALTTGAFRLVAGASSSAGADVGVLGVKVGGQRSESEQELSKDGDVDACRSASDPNTPPAGCGALIRAELVRIDQRPDEAVVKAERVCPPGMHFVEFHGCDADGSPAPSAAAPVAPGPSPGSGDRFVPKAGSVFDTTTGLTWQRDPAPSSTTWEQAKQYCLSLAVDGEAGWRLPHKKELVTLVDKTQAGPKIDTGAFTSAPAAPFWTMSPDTSSAGDAWAVDFHRGVEESKGSGEALHVRCVR